MSKATRRQPGRKAPFVSILSRVVEGHEKRLDEHSKRLASLIDSDTIKDHGERLTEHSRRLMMLEDIPAQMQRLSREFAQLREDITAPLGRLSLDQRLVMRMIVSISDAQKIEVPASLRAQTDEGS